MSRKLLVNPTHRMLCGQVGREYTKISNGLLPVMFAVPCCLLSPCLPWESDILGWCIMLDAERMIAAFLIIL